MLHRSLFLKLQGLKLYFLKLQGVSGRAELWITRSKGEPLKTTCPVIYVVQICSTQHDQDDGDDCGTKRSKILGTKEWHYVIYQHILFLLSCSFLCKQETSRFGVTMTMGHTTLCVVGSAKLKTNSQKESDSAVTQQYCFLVFWGGCACWIPST